MTDKTNKSIWIPNTTITEVETLAAQENRTFSQMVRILLQEATTARS